MDRGEPKAYVKRFAKEDDDGTAEVLSISHGVIDDLWAKSHRLRADELDMLLVRILQSLSHTLGLGVAIVPQNNKPIAALLRGVSWLDDCDEIPIKEDGSVSSLFLRKMKGLLYISLPSNLTVHLVAYGTRHGRAG